MVETEFKPYLVKSLIRISGVGGDLGVKTATHYADKIIVKLDDSNLEVFKSWVDKIRSNGGRKWYGRIYDRAVSWNEK
jgi:hypothetical protein